MGGEILPQTEFNPKYTLKYALNIECQQIITFTCSKELRLINNYFFGIIKHEILHDKERN